ncbi:sortase domain-containing protein [Streptomyces montanisoli]|uniref:Class F sortase n=1 Tax=Streptomyces montanisoli TaxID=2798581 RepID=A0A940RVZ0_9ACTN|nr:sortase [Streptomyces montanisoli]MBP0456563.1 class F sortase [Streptomyces montanisoli]
MTVSGALAGTLAVALALGGQTPPPPHAISAGTVPSRAPAHQAGTPPTRAMPYSVPTSVAISAVGLHALLEPIHTTDSGRITPPDDPEKAGWLRSSASPGQRGTSVLAGHVDSTKGPAAFYPLSSVKPGMRVAVEREDKSTADFTVTAVAVYPQDDFPDSVYAPTAGPSLRLITCTGWDEASHAYRDNVVVYATATSKS